MSPCYAVGSTGYFVRAEQRTPVVNNFVLVDNKIHARCTRCEKLKPAHQQAGEFFDGGIDFIIYGGYGMYYDPFHEDECVKVNLCHDCAVEVLKSIGVYNDPLFKGGHPTERNAEPCCDNCWIPLEDADGKWYAVKSPDGTITMNQS